MHENENPSEYPVDPKQPGRPFPREEPRAEIREFARGMREMYVALLQEGFNEGEALRIIGQVIEGGMAGGRS